jgi:KH domain
MVSRIIGKGGKIKKELETKFSVNINMDSDSSEQVSGSIIIARTYKVPVLNYVFLKG